MNVPKIRFKNYEKEWKKTTLKNVAIINPKNEQIPNEFIYIDLESVNKGILSQEKIISKSSAPSRAQRTIKKNDILFQTVRPYQQNNYFVKETKELPYIASTGYALIRTSEDPYFIYSILHKKDFLDKVIDRCTGTSFPAISANDLGDININIPDIKEQMKVSNFLSLLDKKIELQTKKIEDLKLFKIYLNTRLFNNSKWNKVKLSEVLEISNVRNKKNIYSKNDVLSVSDEFGVVNQIDLQGRSFAAKDVSDYKIVSKGQIIYTRSPLSSKPYGIIKIVGNIEGIVSPLYIINNVKKEFIPKFIYYLFDLPSSTNNYLRPLVRMGAKHTMNINDDEWLSGEIYAPSIGEQEDIVNIFEIINKKIEIENNKLKKITEFKKGLMQNMFV